MSIVHLSAEEKEKTVEGRREKARHQKIKAFKQLQTKITAAQPASELVCTDTPIFAEASSTFILRIKPSLPCS